MSARLAELEALKVLDTDHVCYAGFSLMATDDLVFGTLCVIGNQLLDEEQRHGLRVLSRQVVTQLLVAAFLESSRTQLAELHLAADKGDHGAVGRLAHGLRGAAGSLLRVVERRRSGYAPVPGL